MTYVISVYPKVKDDHIMEVATMPTIRHFHGLIYMSRNIPHKDTTSSTSFVLLLAFVPLAMHRKGTYIIMKTSYLLKMKGWFCRDYNYHKNRVTSPNHDELHTGTR